MADMATTEPSERLAGIRLRRRFLWTVFFSYLPGLWFALKIGGDGLAIGVGMLWLLMAAAGGVMVSFSRCPRCGGRFHMKGISTFWGSRCVHCKLGLDGRG